MKIDGTDPLVLNKIQGKVSRQQVQTLGESDADVKVANRQQPKIKGWFNEKDSYMQELEVAVSQANETVEALNLGIRFKLHEETERYMVQIIDRADNKVIKEIPPERVLNLVGQIQEMIGVLLDEKR